MAENIVQLGVNTETKRAIDQTTGQSPRNTDIVRLVSGERPIIACTFLDTSLAAVVFDGGDTFEMNVDIDFIHDEYEGTINSSYTGAITEIAITFSEDMTGLLRDSGSITLKDSSNPSDRESVDYTAVVISGAGNTVGTFTVSKTLTNSYSSGDYGAVQDRLMAQATEDDVNTGEWSSADKTTGKVSFRLDCRDVKFAEKLAAQDGDLLEYQIYMEIKRYPSGSTIPIVLMQDTIFGRQTVRDLEDVDIPSDENWTPADSRYLKKSGISGGQVAYGGTASGDDLTLSSTSNATKGDVIIGSTSELVVDEANSEINIGNPTTTDAKINIEVGSDDIAFEVRKSDTLYMHQVVSDSVKGVGLLNGTYLAIQNQEGTQDPQLRLLNDPGSNNAEIRAYDSSTPSTQHHLYLSPSGNLYLNPLNDDDIYTTGTGNFGVGLTTSGGRCGIKSGGTTTFPFYVVRSADGIYGLSVLEDASGNYELIMKDSSGTNKVYLDTAGTSYFSGGNVEVTGSVTAISASTQDAVKISGRAGGVGSFVGTITPTTLTASRTYTLPDKTGTIAIDPATGFVEGASNLTTEYRIGYVSATGELTESSAIVTDASGHLNVSASGGGLMSITSSDYADIVLDATSQDSFVTYSVGGVAKAKTGWDFSENVYKICASVASFSGINDFVLDSSGNVLIGTATQYASETLGVNGDVYVNGNLTATGYKDLAEIAPPSTPAAGYGRIYMNSTTSTLHLIDDTGNDVVVGGSVPAFKSSTLTTGASGTYYKFGFYKAPAASVALTQASTTQAYGTANQPCGAHAFIVASAAGTASGGSGAVIIKVTGTSITDAGVRTAADSETIVADITTMSTDSYYESTKKWLGAITFTLDVGATGHTAYAATFNYGLAKYDDFGNRKFTLTDFEMTGLASANDTGFDVEVMHHTNTGWTYSAAAFSPGDGILAKLTTDYSTESDLTNGKDFSYKRDNLATDIDGTLNEGILVRVTTGTNNSVSGADIHLGVEYT